MDAPYVVGDARLYAGDLLDVLPAYAERADLLITSPPYDDLRTFGGHEFDFPAVAAACANALAPGGVLVWVVMDARVDGGETGTSMRQALAFMDLGLSLHDTMIYARKGNNGVTHVGRHWRAWQYMYVFARGRPRTTNIIQDYPRSPKSGTRVSHPTTRQRDGSMYLSRSYDLPELLPRSNVWVYDAGFNKCHPPAQALAHEHPATYPYELAYDHIRTWTNAGDMVIDPMAGSGTTSAAAIALGRRSVGIEIHPPYADIARRRIDVAERDRLNGVDAYGAQLTRLF